MICFSMAPSFGHSWVAMLRTFINRPWEWIMKQLVSLILGIVISVPLLTIAPYTFSNLHFAKCSSDG